MPAGRGAVRNRAQRRAAECRAAEAPDRPPGIHELSACAGGGAGGIGPRGRGASHRAGRDARRSGQRTPGGAGARAAHPESLEHEAAVAAAEMGLGRIGGHVAGRHHRDPRTGKIRAGDRKSRGLCLAGLCHLQLGLAAADPPHPMNSPSTLAEFEARLLRDPFDNVTRLAYARALLAARRETDALAQYDLARKANATPPLDEFERLRAPPTAPTTPREPVKLTVVPGARSAEVVSICLLYTSDAADE